MRVPHFEGGANHKGPESCVYDGNGVGEALTGGRQVKDRRTVLGFVPGFSTADLFGHALTAMETIEV
jgi:hypothetical protein